ncbi:spore coat protein CotF [Cerasibacillus quisquiliarum]|uniref:Spore coat protein F-like protein YhcQ n=1 Tax=Cerasibacillus quisquiliarum TaxID=227865 RepID=A0A511UYK6_9BACI|nr:spore coat protein [Cerasibacillus quisquiliarum]MBB5146962.1 spore coat protein CotF [Cerasibacillus quisquiliarum]GEN31715.1 spore coat protein F-like protein YhcQ [Cerasibacillus quisquiliarum]
MQHQQNQGQQFQRSEQVPPQMNHGGHELFDAHEAISGLVGGMEQYMLYEQHIQDPELKSMLQRHQSFLTQLYNTIVETLKTGQDPTVKTQVYEMTESNDVLFGMQPTQPKTPAQSVQDINDQCISGFMMAALKSSASSFTMTALETTNPVLRRVFADSIPNLIEMAYEVFLYQNRKHYYQVPQLKQEDMHQYMNAFAPVQGGTTMH